MRLTSLVTSLVGVALAGGAVLVAKQMMLERDMAAEAAQTIEYAEVVVARSPIAFGQAIEPHMVTTQQWPAEFVPKGVFTELSKLLPSEEEGARRAKSSFFEGEVILTSKVSRHGDKVTIVSKLGENTRAMAIKVDAVTAVGGFVTPGDFVDIVMTYGRNQELRTITILQNIRVIGVDQRAEEEIDQPGVARTITVEVTPDQGQRLALAQKAGALSLTLRTLEGVIDEPLQSVKLRDLLQEEGPVDDGKPLPVVTVRRAGAAVEEALKSTN